MIVDQWGMGYSGTYTTDVFYDDGMRMIWWGRGVEPEIPYYWRG